MNLKPLASIILALSLASVATPASADETSLTKAGAISDEVPNDLDSLVRNSETPFETFTPKLQLGIGGQVEAVASVATDEDSTLEFSMSPTSPGRTFASQGDLATSEDASNLVQHVAEVGVNSFRFLAEISTVAAARRISYRTNLPQSAYLKLLDDGDYQILDVDGQYYGTLRSPWAIDESGTRFDSKFELQDGVLVQINEISTSAAAPILTDPSWTYLMDFSQHIEDNGSTGIPPTIYFSTRTPQYVTSLLKGCFNCYFPVQGAPSSYPYVGQYMPLYIYNPLTLGLITYNMSVKVTRTFNFGWDFTAQSGHIDGAGSTIKFTWYSDANSRLHLKVDAFIINNNPIDLPATTVDFDRGVYTGQARATWQSFFNAVT